MGDLDRLLNGCAVDQPQFALPTISGSRSPSEGADAELAALELPSNIFLDTDLDAFS